jgi:hypothetical protein
MEIRERKTFALNSIKCAIMGVRKRGLILLNSKARDNN